MKIVGRLRAAVVVVLCCAQTAFAQADVPSSPPSSVPAAAPAPQAAAASAPPTLPDVAAFYGAPTLQSAKLSPSGRWLAMAGGFGRPRVGLAVFDVQEWKPLGFVANYSDGDIGDFAWVGDDRLVYNISDRQRGGGDQRWWPGLFSVHRDGSGPRQLVAVDHAFFTALRTPAQREPLPYWHELLHVPDDGSGDVIVAEYQWDGGRQFTGFIAKRLNATSGRATTLSLGAPENVWRYLFDAAGEPRVAVTRRAGREAVHWRGKGDAAWRQLGEHAAFDAPSVPAFVGSEGDLYVLVSGGSEGAGRLHRWDFSTGKPAAEPLVSTPGFDFRGTLASETVGSRTLGVRLQTDGETTVWFDLAMQAMQAKADARLPGHVNRVDCRRCGKPDMVALVTAYSDRDPGQLWVYQAANDSWRKVSNQRNAIDPRQMGTTGMERVAARDGLPIPLWVTRPAGGAAGPRPAVLLVHGGPWSRGRSWQWADDAQFLASRGYVVLEPEFRGSTGYGQRLFRAGWRQWGQAMQDDLADTLEWAVKQGIVDPKRVCIAGASYGGYATLMGLARHPELFRCGVAWVAVSDPRLMFNWRRDGDFHDESRNHSFPQLIGDPVTDAEMLTRVAPVAQAERIKAPLLLAYGAQDRRVPLVHGERMRDALIKAGRPPEWVLYGDEAHGWNKPENRVDFGRRLEQFLARHLQ